MIRFVIAGTQRTGTTLIQSTLDKHSGICAYGEVFLIRKGRGGNVHGSYRSYLNHSPLSRHVRHYFSRESIINEYLDQLGADTGAHAIGFKLMLGQVRLLPNVKEYVCSHDYKIIQVMRRNALKILVSRTAMLKCGVAHTKKKLETNKIILPTRKLIKNLDYINNESSWAEREFKKLPLLTVWYEDFVDNKMEQLERICKFLDVPYQIDVASNLVKLNPDNLSELIENYDDVVKALQGTRHEKYII